MTLAIPNRTLLLRAFSSTGQGREWKKPLDFEVDVEQTHRKRPNKATIKVRDLSSGSVAFLEEAAKVEVVANEGLLYRGVPRTVRTKVALPDQETEIECADGGDVYRNATLSRSWAPGVTTELVLADLTASTGFALDTLGQLQHFEFEDGYVVAGPVRDAIDDIVTSLGAAWSIQDHVIQILAAGAPSSGGVLLTAGSGLVGSPERTDDGIACKSLLRPSLRPGKLFRLESRLITGWFRTKKSNHKAHSFGVPWETSLDAVEA